APTAQFAQRAPHHVLPFPPDQPLLCRRLRGRPHRPVVDPSPFLPPSPSPALAVRGDHEPLRRRVRVVKAPEILEQEHEDVLEDVIAGLPGNRVPKGNGVHQPLVPLHERRPGAAIALESPPDEFAIPFHRSESVRLAALDPRPTARRPPYLPQESMAPG